jgi:hypothetical protein
MPLRRRTPVTQPGGPLVLRLERLLDKHDGVGAGGQLLRQGVDGGANVCVVLVDRRLSDAWRVASLRLAQQAASSLHLTAPLPSLHPSLKNRTPLAEVVCELQRRQNAQVRATAAPHPYQSAPPLTQPPGKLLRRGKPGAGAAKRAETVAMPDIVEALRVRVGLASHRSQLAEVPLSPPPDH